MNAATDTLHNNSNLAKWQRGTSSDLCKLCGEKQTLLHVLNNCNVALQLRRYNKRHDKILSIISDMAYSHCQDSYCIAVDLEEQDYNFPSHITSTNLRPDLVIWSDQHRRLYIVELTVCFETGFDKAERRKEERYSELAENARRSGYRSTILPIQIGSRGIIDEDGMDKFRTCLRRVTSKKWKEYMIAITPAAIEESFAIWCQQNKSY